MNQEETFGIFIDGDNISPKYFSIINELIKKRGKIIIKKVYGDFTEDNMKNWKKISINFGIEPIMVWREKNKNSSDIKMVSDIMEILFTFSYLKNFVLVTGDYDFRDLCRKIIMFNKNVIGISCYQKSTSQYLKNFCNEFFILDSIDKTKLNTKEIIIQNIKDILNSHNSNIMNLGLLKSKLLNIDSEFNEINYGFGSFKEFIKSFDNEIVISEDINRSLCVGLK